MIFGMRIVRYNPGYGSADQATTSSQRPTMRMRLRANDSHHVAIRYTMGTCSWTAAPVCKGAQLPHSRTGGAVGQRLAALQRCSLLGLQEQAKDGCLRNLRAGCGEERISRDANGEQEPAIPLGLGRLHGALSALSSTLRPWSSYLPLTAYRASIPICR